MGKLDALAALVGSSGIPANPVAVAAPKAEELVSAPVFKSMADKLKAVKAVEAALNKQFSVSNSIVRMGDKVHQDIPAISGDLYTFDYGALGCGGIPRGRIIELYGPESAGKTTVALHYVGKEQKNGELAAFVDAEHALDPTYASQNGVDMDNLLVSQPDSGEQALETVEALVISRAVSLIVVDSVAALVPQAELDGEMGDSVVYETPVYIRKKGTTLVDICQVGDLHRKKSTGWYKKTSTLEVLTHDGWQSLLGVQKKKNVDSKKIIYTKTSQGYVGTTGDHSLFVGGQEKSPKELSVFDRVDTYDAYIERGLCNVVSDDISWLLGFYVAEGTTPRTAKCNRFEVCNTEPHLLEKCRDIIKERFSLDAEIRQASEQTDTRKILYVLTIPANETLGWFMHQCVEPKSKVKRVPIFILNGNKDITAAFLDGFWHGDGNHSEPTKSRKFFNDSWLVMAGIKFINEVPTTVTVNTSRPWQLTLLESGTKTFAHNEVRAFHEADGPEFLYDLSTAAGTFVTAVGNIVCHNSHMGLQARLMSQAMRKLRGKCAANGVTVIFINQLREKIGQSFGNPETTTGGRALKFYASVRVDIRKVFKENGGANITSGGVTIGHQIRLKVVKNKVGKPFQSTEVDLIYGQGLDTKADMIEYGINVGAIKQSGAWFSFGENKNIQGKAALKSLLKGDEAALSALKVEIEKAHAAQKEADKQ